MRARVLKLTASGMCEARTENDLLLVFAVPAGALIQPADELELGTLVPSGTLIFESRLDIVRRGHHRSNG